MPSCLRYRCRAEKTRFAQNFCLGFSFSPGRGVPKLAFRNRKQSLRPRQPGSVTRPCLTNTSLASRLAGSPSHAGCGEKRRLAPRAHDGYLPSLGGMWDPGWPSRTSHADGRPPMHDSAVTAVTCRRDKGAVLRRAKSGLLLALHSRQALAVEIQEMAGVIFGF